MSFETDCQDSWEKVWVELENLLDFFLDGAGLPHLERDVNKIYELLERIKESHLSALGSDDISD